VYDQFFFFVRVQSILSNRNVSRFRYPTRSSNRSNTFKTNPSVHTTPAHATSMRVPNETSHANVICNCIVLRGGFSWVLFFFFFLAFAFAVRKRKNQHSYYGKELTYRLPSQSDYGFERGSRHIKYSSRAKKNVTVENLV